jgi:hypothetical protein
MSSGLAALIELISGEHGRNAAQALNGMLDHSKELNVGLEQSGQALVQVGELSSRVRQAFAALHNTVAVFRTLCTLTRIETARLGTNGSDFGDLAEEVGPLSDLIQSSGEGVLEASSQLGLCVESAIQSGAGLRRRQLQELPRLIAGVTDGLGAFEERRQKAVQSSARQAEQYGALCDAIDSLVRSVQFHDITRQQVEHVIAALQQLRSERQGGGNAQSVPSETRAILTLQSSQLVGAAETFVGSAERMRRDLESIAARAREMAEASRALMGISEGEQDSFFRQMEGHFTGILKMLDSCTATQAEMESTAGHLEETISGMRDSVAEIRGIEIRIQRIATNATIRATHIGATGNSLNVIAEIMQSLALDSNTNTEQVADTLVAMSAAALDVSGGHNSNGMGAHGGRYEAINGMRRMVLDMHSSSERSYSRVDEIAVLGARLAEGIEELLQGFSAASLFARVVEHACGELDRIKGQSQGESEGVGEVATTLQLETLARRYTMQTERDVHESLVRGLEVALPEVTPAESPAESVGGEDLGDNVELF